MDLLKIARKKYNQIECEIFIFFQKHYKYIVLLLFILLGWKLYEPHLMELFNCSILPFLSELTFSPITNIIFSAICLIWIFGLISMFKRRYYLPVKIVPYLCILIYEYAKYRIRGDYVALPNYMLGLGYTDVLIILLGCTITVVLFIRFFSVSQTQYQTSGFLLDRPIENPNDDILDYKTIAEDLVKKINAIDSEKSCSIGLVAHWGMGKTSFLNILEQTLPQNNYITLMFNPRHSYTTTNIQKDFFDLLYSALSKYDIRFTSSFRNYLKSINVLVDKSLVSKMFHVHEIWDKEVQKENVNDAIKRINKRIVVIIDDFDRLVRDEIIEIFKLIDGNASFTNIIFISAYDKAYTNNIVDNQSFKQQTSFSDKFFTIEIPLPFRPYSKIYDYLLEQLVNLTDASEEQKNEYDKVLTDNIEILECYLPTLRDVKRFLNLFIRPYIDVQDEVVFRDYFLLNLIKLRYFDEYDKLYRKKYIHYDVLNYLGQYVINEKLDCNCRDILERLFSDQPYSYRSINNKSAFYIYFYESVYDDMKIKDMKKVFTMPSMTDVHAYITTIDKTKFDSFLTYLRSVNYLSFPNFNQFNRYISIWVYLISNDIVSVIDETIVSWLIYKKTSLPIQKRYQIGDKEYKSFLYAQFKGEYPNYPFSVIRSILVSLINGMIYEEIIGTREELFDIACTSLEDLITKKPTVGRLHIELLRNCIDDIDANTNKATLNKNMCEKVCSAIKQNPKEYFSKFVYIGGFSSRIDCNSIVCEPFYEQIFGSREKFETYLHTLDEKQIPAIELVRNFWELYKYNDYTPIEFYNQGNVQEKINNKLTEEVGKLRQLLEIKDKFEKNEKERLSEKKEVGSYIQQYQTYLNQINNIGLYIKLNEILQTKIRDILSEISKKQEQP